MIIKKIKEYGNKTKRQRIDLNKSDGLTPGSEVVLIPVEKYNSIKQDILDLQNELMTARNESEMAMEVNANLEKQIQSLKDQEINLRQIVEDVTAPIDEHYQNELKSKDDKIKELEFQLKSIKAKTNQYNLELMGLNIFDFAIFRKHKKLIHNFNDEITIVGDDPNIIDADTKELPGNDDQEQ